MCPINWGRRVWEEYEQRTILEMVNLLKNITRKRNNAIHKFSQSNDESLYKAWTRVKDKAWALVKDTDRKCLNHDIAQWV